MSKEGNPGCNALANVFGGMMRKQIDAQDKPAEYGVIQPDYSLVVPSLGEENPIPKSDYNVCRQLTYDPSVPLTQTYNDGSHGHPDASPPGTHVHNVKLPEKMYWIRPGDRVIVLWIDNEANIVDIIYNGDRVG